MQATMAKGIIGPVEQTDFQSLLLSPEPLTFFRIYVADDDGKSVWFGAGRICKIN